MGWSVETPAQCWSELSEYEKAHWLAFLEVFSEDFEARRPKDESNTQTHKKIKGRNVKRASRELPRK